ncbi:RNA-binding protein [archaeon]|jgi:exosome complex component RRP4|nr:RNA-binding protein [archaeon]MBT4023126.1 RNA-binding protein [archaeon]MBT4271871.1 RNA-binding protein [archaeon]MBT4460759.1 RNA-binding protein [archaeon]MBT4858826.1 RNA-binding protein [archaeon]
MEKGKLLIKDKEVVVPGEVLAQGMSYLPSQGTYRKGNDVIASKLGLARVEGNVVKIIPVSGRYLPKKGDVIIAKVTDINIAGWTVDTNSAYRAMLSMKDATSDFIRRGSDLTRYFDIDDYMVTKIFNVTSQNLVDLTMKGPGLKKLEGGRIMTVSPSKVPRIIGKQGSMVSMIKQATSCNIIVGQNGVVFVKGINPEDEILTVKTIKKIEEESHVAGLTDKIKEFLDKKSKKR